MLFQIQSIYKLSVELSLMHYELSLMLFVQNKSMVNRITTMERVKYFVLSLLISCLCNFSNFIFSFSDNGMWDFLVTTCEILRSWKASMAKSYSIRSVEQALCKTTSYQVRLLKRKFVTFLRLAFEAHFWNYSTNYVIVVVFLDWHFLSYGS